LPPETEAGGTYDNPAVNKNCNKNPQTPSPVNNDHSTIVFGRRNGTAGTNAIARNEMIVVTEEK
jgi:hypothetical protein